LKPPLSKPVAIAILRGGIVSTTRTAAHNSDHRRSHRADPPIAPEEPSASHARTA